MGVLDILASQLVEPFRIGLLIALTLTAANTAQAVGRLVPTVLGLIFVAVLIPMTLGSAGADRLTAIIVGLFSNAIILAVILAAHALYRRLTQR
ncbi:MAG: hypothetical protein AB7P20_22145 [Rhizobiaceae bacterium]